MPLNEEQESALVELLALVYASVPWSKMSTSKSSWDIWNHRVRAASTRGTLPEFVSRLCNQLGLQSVPAPCIELIARLKPLEHTVLDAVYREHIYYSMRAALRAREIKERRTTRENTTD